jgi:hypothetical protein
LLSFAKSVEEKQRYLIIVATWLTYAEGSSESWELEEEEEVVTVALGNP